MWPSDLLAVSVSVSVRVWLILGDSYRSLPRSVRGSKDIRRRQMCVRVVVLVLPLPPYAQVLLGLRLLVLRPLRLSTTIITRRLTRQRRMMRRSRRLRYSRRRRIRIRIIIISSNTRTRYHYAGTCTSTCRSSHNCTTTITGIGAPAAIGSLLMLMPAQAPASRRRYGG